MFLMFFTPLSTFHPLLFSYFFFGYMLFFRHHILIPTTIPSSPPLLKDAYALFFLELCHSICCSVFIVFRRLASRWHHTLYIKQDNIFYLSNNEIHYAQSLYGITFWYCYFNCYALGSSPLPSLSLFLSTRIQISIKDGDVHYDGFRLDKFVIQTHTYTHTHMHSQDIIFVFIKIFK